MRISKDHLPKGHSFVLRSSELERALDAAGIEVETSLQHLSSTSCFTAHFLLPNPNVAHERFYVTAGMVPAERARQARELMSSMVIPQFIAWAKVALALPVNSTVRSQQFFRVDLSDLAKV